MRSVGHLVQHCQHGFRCTRCSKHSTTSNYAGKRSAKDSIVLCITNWILCTHENDWCGIRPRRSTFSGASIAYETRFVDSGSPWRRVCYVSIISYCVCFMQEQTPYFDTVDVTYHNKPVVTSHGPRVLTSMAASLTPNFPLVLGPANRCVFQESNSRLARNYAAGYNNILCLLRQVSF
jgi:hypothetical protein